MTHSFPTRRSSDLVVAEALPDHLLDEEGLFIGAAARRNAADRACAILRLDTAKLARGVSDGFVPAHLAPRLADRGPDHRFQYRSEEHTPELQSLMRSSYAVFCLKKKQHN